MHTLVSVLQFFGAAFDSKGYPFKNILNDTLNDSLMFIINTLLKCHLGAMPLIREMKALADIHYVF